MADDPNGTPVVEITVPDGWAGELEPIDALRTYNTHIPAVSVSVQTWADLRRIAALTVGACTVSTVSVTLRAWRPPQERWSGRVGPVDHIVATAIARTPDGIVMSLDTAEPVALAEALTAMVRAVMPHHRLPGTLSPTIDLRPDADQTGAWIVPIATTLSSVDRPVDDRIRQVDALLAADLDAAGRLAFGPHLASPTADGFRWVQPDGRWAQVPAPVDPLIHRPVGRDPRSEAQVARLRAVDGRLTIDGAASGVVDITDGVGLADVTDLQAFDHVEVDPSASRSAHLLSALARLSAVGLVVRHPAHTVAQGFPLDLQRAWIEAPQASDDLLTRTVASVHQRRLAHRDVSTIGALTGWLAERSEVTAAPSLSIILPSRSPELTKAAIRQIATFDYPQLEVVVGLHTASADPRAIETIGAERGVRVRAQVFDPDYPFGAVIGQLCSIADGDLVTKMDDDDYYGPQHLWDLVVALRYSGAQLVGKVAEYLFLEPLDLTVRRTNNIVEGYGRAVAGGTMLIGREDLRDVGGWRELPRSVDLGLMENVERAGGLIYRTHGLGYIYVRGDRPHTWDVPPEKFLSAVDQQWTGLLRHPEFGTAEA